MISHIIALMVCVFVVAYHQILFLIFEHILEVSHRVEEFIVHSNIYCIAFHTTDMG